MATRTFIHVGTTKTGTTSIQRAMAQEAGRLRRGYSVNYPETTGNHMVLALPFLDNQNFGPFENHIRRGYATMNDLRVRADNLLASLTRDARRFDTHVLSSEQLQFLDEGSIGRLKRFFDYLGVSVSIILYVRHPAERVSSLVNQRLRGGHFSLSTISVEDDVLAPLQRYVGVFGKANVIVRRFGARYWPGGRLIDDFTSVFHGTPIGGMPELKANESLSLPAVLIADQLFDVAPLRSGNRGDEAWLHRIAGPRFLVPRALAEKAMEASRACLEYLQKEFAIGFDEVDFSRFPETLSTEFSAETLKSLGVLLNEQSRLLPPKREARRRPNLVRRLKQRFVSA
jgi:hypothetical protein